MNNTILCLDRSRCSATGFGEMSAQDLRMSFLNSPDWEDRLRRTFLYPGTQSLDDVMPLDISGKPALWRIMITNNSEFCVEHFRELAPKNAGKLGPRIATRLMRNTALCPSAIVAALIYLQRLKAHNPEYLKKVESSELFIVSMMVSSKYLFDDGTDDECYNDEWASCLGMESKDLNKMELAFLTVAISMKFLKRVFYFNFSHKGKFILRRSTGAVI